MQLRHKFVCRERCVITYLNLQYDAGTRNYATYVYEDNVRLGFDMLFAAGAPVKGLLHASGAVLDAMLPNQAPSLLWATAAPKTVAALSAANRGVLWPLGMLHFFSSVASQMGSSGQANYAAANAGLDYFAHVLASQVRCRVCPCTAGTAGCRCQACADDLRD